MSSEGAPLTMSSADEHRQRAAECFALARQISDANDKSLMLEIAAAWKRLAEWAEAKERNEEKRG
jgi:hypothetical protein